MGVQIKRTNDNVTGRILRYFTEYIPAAFLLYACFTTEARTFLLGKAFVMIAPTRGDKNYVLTIPRSVITRNGPLYTIRYTVRR